MYIPDKNYDQLIKTIEEISHYNRQQNKTIMRKFFSFFRNNSKRMQMIRNGIAEVYEKLYIDDRGVKDTNCFEKNDYVFKERVAVYTCVTGNYDDLRDPLIESPNCDYFVICDRNYKLNSLIWKKIYYDDIEDLPPGLSNNEINRYFKMFPFSVFGNYDYSLYIDANCQISTDINKLMNKIGKIGISMHIHNRGVYDELKIVNIMGKATKREIDIYKKRLEDLNITNDVGMLSCGIIARHHKNDICRRLMKEWWDEYCAYIKRDQLNFAYILCKNSISCEEIGTMNGFIYEDKSFCFFDHN